MASSKRIYLINALDPEEALDRAMDEATRPNWHVKVMRPDKWAKVYPTTQPEWWKVVLYVSEAA